VKIERPTASVDVHEGKAQFSRLLTRAAAGDEIVITRSGQPVARLVAAVQSGLRPLGMDAGQVVIAADFDDSVPDDILRHLGQ
jgi:prevent-host-death family protein